MSVFVVDKRKLALMPCCEKRARQLLSSRRARIHRLVPFTIRLVDREVATCALQQIRLSIDPGSKITGIALSRESSAVDAHSGEITVSREPLFLAELAHRGSAISESLRQRRGFRRRRRGNLRYREARFDNRERPKGWLAPSLQHRVDSTRSWVTRLRRVAPVSVIGMELVRFDTQAIGNPDIQGVEYQQGTLAGYEVREYLLEKWQHQCAYCGARDTPLEMEHIRPKSRGGSNRVTNLVMACVSCNRQKDSSTLEEFLAGDQVLLQKILAQVRVPLRDAAAVNTTRWALFQALEQSQLPVTTSSGGRTKWNRSRLGIPKTHALDALCVGLVDAISQWMIPVLAIKAAGRGAYQRTLLTKHGFPRGYLTRQKQHYGVQTGDFVVADIKTGKRAGVHKGRVAIRASGYFNIQTVQGVVQGVSHRYCRLLHRADGYGYSQQRDKKQESGEGHTIPPRPTGRGIPRS